MRNYIAVVFNGPSTAYEGLRALWELDRALDITVHGSAVVHRDELGQFQVDTKETHPALATAVGVGLGALLGALAAGPAGAAAGAAGGASMGAIVGGSIGLGVDADRADTRQEAADESRFVLGAGQSAVIADVSEDSRSAIDMRMRKLGGTVYRRAKRDVKDEASFHEDDPRGYLYSYDTYLYPYEYVP